MTYLKKCDQDKIGGELAQRKVIRSDTRLAALQIVSANGTRFAFESKQLIMLTRSA